MLIARDNFTVGEKLSLHRCGPRRTGSLISDYVFQVEDLRHGMVKFLRHGMVEDLRHGIFKDVHCIRLKFYHDLSLNTEAIMPHLVSSETAMPVQRLMRLIESEEGLFVLICWRGMPQTEETLEPLNKIHEDVPQLLEKLFCCKNIPDSLVAKALHTLAL